MSVSRGRRERVQLARGAALPGGGSFWKMSAGPCVHSRGATIWALGFKTEYESQKLLAEAGARTEILGGFIYPIGAIPKDRPQFESRDSALSLVYGVSVYQSNHQVHIRDVRANEVRETGNTALQWTGSRARMELYTSDARESPARHKTKRTTP